MQKIVKLNRAFLYCCMVVVFCLHATGYAAPKQGKPVTISIKNSTLADVLRQVSKKSGLYIYFQDADLAAHKNVTIDVRNKPVESVLHELLDGRGLSWVEVSENTIAVKKKSVVEERKNDIGEDTVSTITVTGRVVDEKGEPVIGATVMVKGGKVGTITNPNGDFVLNDVKANAMIVISNVSSLPEVIPVRGRGSIGKILLKGKVGELDEVVVIPYGSTTRRLNTGNVVSIKANDIEKQPVNNPLLALAGRVPGLQVSQASGFSGGGIQILIQGQNSLRKGNDPFYVIDGVPYVSQLLPNMGDVLRVSQSAGFGEANNGNPLSFLNPADIESIEVLKDADATAIYGSRAANGAILITTKKGKPGQTKVDFTVQNGFARVVNRLDLLETQEYLKMRREAYHNDGLPIPDKNTAGDPTNYDLTVWDENLNNDWQKELLGKTARYTDAQLTISGGSVNSQYLIGGGYHKETSVLPSDFSDTKASMHFNVGGNSNNQKFKFQLSGSYLVDNNKLTTTDLTQKAVTLAPNAPHLYNQDGTLNWGIYQGVSTWENPLAFLEAKYRNKTSNLIGNTVVSYQLSPEIELKSNFGYTSLQSNEIKTNPLSIVAPELRSSPFVARRAFYGDNAIESWIVEPQISYLKYIGKGRLSALIGSTFQRRNSSRQLLEAKGFNSDYVLDNINAATSIVVPENSTIESVFKYSALFARLNYNWYDKYIVNLTARRDGTSRFGVKNRLHNFGAIGMAWVFSKEQFMADAISPLSFGKFRLSYGTTGNDQIEDYLFLSLYSNNSPAIPYSGGSALVPTRFTNPLLQWEETKKFSIGLDLGFFKDRVMVNASYFKNTSSNQLLTTALPTMAGMPSISINLPATVQNTGLELAFEAQFIKQGDFSWVSNFNITLPRNKLASFKNLESSVFYSADYKIGEPITNLRLYNFRGVNPETGIYEYIDKKGDIVNTPNSDYDNRTVFVNTSPKSFGGFENIVSFKGVSVDFTFQFVVQDASNYFYGSGLPGAFSPNNQPATILDRWQKKGDVSPVQKYSFVNFDVLNPAFNINESTAAWGDASYIRLKNLSLSWQIPKRILNTSHIKNARVFVHGQNLLTFTGYKGLDPETKSSLVLPPLRVLTIGANITL